MIYLVWLISPSVCLSVCLFFCVSLSLALFFALTPYHHILFRSPWHVGVTLLLERERERENLTWLTDWLSVVGFLLSCWYGETFVSPYLTIAVTPLYVCMSCVCVYNREIKNLIWWHHTAIVPKSVFFVFFVVCLVERWCSGLHSSVVDSSRSGVSN